MKHYTLHCVHKGIEHYLQTAPELAGVKVTRGKVISWLAVMGVDLDNAFTATLVIREDGVPILQAAYGPPHHAWRKYEQPAEPPKPQVHLPMSPGNVWRTGGETQKLGRATRSSVSHPAIRVVPSFAELEDALASKASNTADPAAQT